mmetsp:Transcript_34073/g.50443  ORF Transcript_34073/g.50443 Transcript_34073/m.50443 type:complete len:93 (-) Transcript_34073:395-673(-)
MRPGGHFQWQTRHGEGFEGSPARLAKGTSSIATPKAVVVDSVEESEPDHEHCEQPRTCEGVAEKKHEKRRNKRRIITLCLSGECAANVWAAA